MNKLRFEDETFAIKAVNILKGEHKAQLLNYLKATNIEVGLLVNFGCYPKAIIERIVL